MNKHISLLFMIFLPDEYGRGLSYYCQNIKISQLHVLFKKKSLLKNSFIRCSIFGRKLWNGNGRRCLLIFVKLIIYQLFNFGLCKRIILFISTM